MGKVTAVVRTKDRMEAGILEGDITEAEDIKAGDIKVEAAEDTLNQLAVESAFSKRA